MHKSQNVEVRIYGQECGHGSSNCNELNIKIS